MAGCTIGTPDLHSLAGGQVRPRSARVPRRASAADCPAASLPWPRLPGRPEEYVHNTFPYVFDATCVVPPEYQRQVHFPLRLAWGTVLISCRSARLLLARVRSLFRVIPAKAYLDYFASDRSHMVRVGRHSGFGARRVGLTSTLAITY